MDEEQVKKLSVYYKTCYPFKEVASMIPINENREISFTLLSSGYCRYNTFSSYEDLALKVQKLCPVQIDIGAIYSEPPTKGAANKALAKELVFDIDLTDYPRACCSGKAVCSTCFVIVKAGMRVLDFSLRHEFGFEHINFFFSGGRGLHCWVGDKEAMFLSNCERRSIVSYFSTVLGKHLYCSEYRKILKRYSDKEGRLLFEALFVRLDANVTSEIKHLLKAPFCIHSSTQRVAVALNVDSIDSLCIENIPTLDEAIANPTILSPFISNMSLRHLHVGNSQ